MTTATIKTLSSKFGTGIFLLAASDVFLVFLLTQNPAASKPLGLRPGPHATVVQSAIKPIQRGMDTKILQPLCR